MCDLICVLIWCPFRLIMKNRCCTTCRIFNWDHLMMFSPLIFMGGFFASSLVILSAVAWLVWELCVFGIIPTLHCSAANVPTSFVPSTARNSVLKYRKRYKEKRRTVMDWRRFLLSTGKSSSLVDLQAQMIGYHRNEFTVGRFASAAGDGGAEIFLHGV